jgi:glycosyltransferase involved in cell wall biosynthesis
VPVLQVTNSSLPRVCYIGDVPIESSYHGSALLYRLLKDYPPANLVVIEQGPERSLPSRRLPGARYEEINLGALYWLNTRLNSLVTTWVSITAGLRSRRVPPLMNNFQPQVVLTVAHGFAWLTASSFARRRQLPLVMIVHDDWASVANFVGLLKPWLNRRFGEVYRQCASRLCVSPFMVEEFERRYGVTGTVLYPSREMGAPTFQYDKVTGQQERPFTVAYAGSFHTVDYIRQLTVLGRILNELDGRLLLFGPYDAKALLTAGMNMQNVKLAGLLDTSAELIGRLRDECDLLFLPMSFAPNESRAFALNFPSKLTDYTATGLPILIWGPSESSGVKWAMAEPGVAAVVTDPDERAMSATIRKLKHDVNWRNRLGATAAEAGQRYFSPESAKVLLYEHLHKALPPAGQEI